MIKHIQVTAEDLKLGIAGEPQSCPVYLAVSRVCPSVEGIYEEYIKYYMSNDIQDTRLIEQTLPEEAANFVGLFDMAHEMESNIIFTPFEFDLDVPNAALW